MSRFSRRNFLQIVGIAGGVVALRQVASHIPLARADGSSGTQLFLLAYMEGGWDQLLALDPRDATDARFRDDAARKQGGSGICPAYELVTEPETKALLAKNPTGVQKFGTLTFGPAVPLSLAMHYADLSIVRGLSMDTLTHEVGRRYLMTGKFPRGLAASGSSITSLVASESDGSAVLPNLAVNTESYAEGLPSFASATKVANASEMAGIFRPFGKPISAASGDAIEAFQAADDTCAQHELDGLGMITTTKQMTAKARSLSKSDASLFQFQLTSPPAAVQKLFDAMGIVTAADLAGPRGRAAVAAQALATGFSRAVSVQLSSGLDDHTDWDTDHAPNLRGGLDALGRLIQVLKNTPHKEGGSVWSKTTLLLFSDFARTPLLNTRTGRDHHLASSVMVAGPKIAGNRVVGATSDLQMGVQPIDLASGKVDPKGVVVHPQDVHATLLTSMGLDLQPISNQNPNVISALLKA
jgi:uncharacterized protein (DUF1501 family)